MSDSAVNFRHLAVGDRLGEWRLTERLGENESGEVWRAQHRTLQRLASVTVATDPAQAAVLRQSGQAHQRVDDSRVVRTLGLAPDHQPPYLVLEFVEGESLRVHLERGLMAWGQALAITRAILAGLVVAHQKRVVHGALRPERILLPHAGGVKLSGFATPPGVRAGEDAVVISDVLDPDGIRRARELEYVAPELRTGGTPTVVGDVYSVGVIAYEMCTGDLPHGAESAHDVVSAVPPDLADVLRKAYGRAELRYGSAAAMLAALPASASDRRRVPQAVPVAFPTATPSATLRIGSGGDAEDIGGAADGGADIRFADGRARCQACEHLNPLGNRFCVRCGRALHPGTTPARACPKCKSTMPPHHRFCPRCGVELPEVAGSGA